MNLNNLSFAGKKHLHELLNVEPGAVTPFGLLNDIEKKINYYFKKLRNRYKSVYAI